MGVAVAVATIESVVSGDGMRFTGVAMGTPSSTSGGAPSEVAWISRVEAFSERNRITAMNVQTQMMKDITPAIVIASTRLCGLRRGANRTANVSASQDARWFASAASSTPPNGV